MTTREPRIIQGTPVNLPEPQQCLDCTKQGTHERLYGNDVAHADHFWFCDDCGKEEEQRVNRYYAQQTAAFVACYENAREQQGWKDAVRIAGETRSRPTAPKEMPIGSMIFQNAYASLMGDEKISEITLSDIEQSVYPPGAREYWARKNNRVKHIDTEEADA